MKFCLATLTAVVYAAVQTNGSLPTSIDANTDSLSTVTVDFGTNYGSWSVMLYGATVSNVEGFYLKVEESGLTMATGDVEFAPADGAAQYGATFSLIMMFNDEEIDKDGSEEYWTVQYSATSASPVATWASASILQLIQEPGSINTDTSEALDPQTSTATTAYKLYSWENTIWNTSANQYPANVVYRLLPEDSSSTDGRPEPDSVATAYYGAVGGAATSNANTVWQVTGSIIGNAQSTEFTWLSASSLTATATAIIAAYAF